MCLESLLFCSALSVGDPHPKVAYKLLQAVNVVGLPPGVKLSHPSTLSQDQLQVIYDNIASMRFIGELSVVSCVCTRYQSDRYIVVHANDR